MQQSQLASLIPFRPNSFHIALILLFLLLQVLFICRLVLVYFQMIFNQHSLNHSQKTTLDSNDKKNNRPISDLSFLSKLIERVIANQLQLHLSSNGLMSEYQSAYRKFHSSETALLCFQNILVSLDIYSLYFSFFRFWPFHCSSFSLSFLPHLILLIIIFYFIA